MNSGDLYNVEIPLSDGHEQAGTRPAIIVQASQFEEQLPTILIMNSSEPRIMAIQVTEDAIIADLVDGRRISVPLAWSWRLEQATRRQRRHWEIIGAGHIVHWPEVDEHLSVDGFLKGTPAPRPKSHRQR